MVSDSLTYVYSSHEWQQHAPPPPSAGIIETQLAAIRTLASGDCCSVRVRGRYSSFWTLLSTLLLFIAAALLGLKQRERSEKAISLCKPLAGCTARQA